VAYIGNLRLASLVVLFKLVFAIHLEALSVSNLHDDRLAIDDSNLSTGHAAVIHLVSVDVTGAICKLSVNHRLFLQY
jgi:hypothetical protein